MLRLEKPLRIRILPNGKVARIVIDTGGEEFPKAQWNALRTEWNWLPEADLGSRILTGAATSREINMWLDGLDPSKPVASVEHLGTRRFAARLIRKQWCVVVEGRQETGPTVDLTVELVLYFQLRWKETGSRLAALAQLNALKRLGYTDVVIEREKYKTSKDKIDEVIARLAAMK